MVARTVYCDVCGSNHAYPFCEREEKMEDKSEFAYQVGQLVKFKLTKEIVMILKCIPRNEIYGVLENGYMIRMSNNLNEIFVREFELEFISN